MKNVDIIFSSYLNSIVGPVQTLKRIVSNHRFFSENGCNLTLFTLDYPKGTQTLTDYQVSSVSKRSHSLIALKIKEFARFLAQHSFLYDSYRIHSLISAPRKFVRNYCAQNREPDIMVFHYMYDCYNYLMLEKKVKPKIVLFIHGDSAKRTMLLEYFPKAKGTSVEKHLASISSFVLNNVDRVISISKIGANNFLNEFPLLDGKIGVVVNGINDITLEQMNYVNEKRSEAHPKKYRLITCGTINGRKGQRVVIEALYKIPKEINEEIEYTIVGDGPERVTLENKVKEYGLNNVRFVGSVPNVNVYKYLAEANISILMSNNEGLPISLIESLRCGLAGISTRVAGIPEVIIDGYNGVIIQPDVKQLVYVLSHMGDYDWDDMGKKSRILFEKEYTFDRMKRDYLKMLNSLI